MPNPTLMIGGLVAAIVLAAIFLVLGQFATLWLQAIFSQTRVSPLHMLAMRMRGVEVRLIVLSSIRAEKAGLDVSPHQLEAHHRAGGRVSNCVTAMIAAARAGKAVAWDIVAEADLAGLDILALTAEAAGCPLAAPTERGPREEQFVRAVAAAPPSVRPIEA
ncbi:MAG: flotillin-like FloA family protein [Phycisphaerales bacterium JB039]